MTADFPSVIRGQETIKLYFFNAKRKKSTQKSIPSGKYP